MTELHEGAIGPTWGQMQPGMMIVRHTVAQDMTEQLPAEQPVQLDGMASLYHNRERTMRIAEMAPFCGGIGHAYEI